MLLHTERSAAQSERCIELGDLVVVYEGFDSMKSVRVAAGGQYNNKYGSFAHKDWLGRPFGSKARARRGDGWVLLLAPTPELWTSVLRHRTQILYVADIAMVCALLELRPGCTVLESGTGSGSLTHSLARAVAPHGQVWTYEFHEQRAQMATAEFEANGLGSLVTVTQRDIEENGFPEDRHAGKADAVFLDLPKPYKVVPSASRCVRPDGMFCAFSPCIEQVQRTCEALNAHGFRDIRTMEVLLRQHEVSRQALLDDLEMPPQQQQQQQGAAGGRKQQRRQEQQGGGGGGRGAKRQRVTGGAPLATAGAARADGGEAAASGEASAPAAAPAAGGSTAAALESQAVAASEQQQAVQQQAGDANGNGGSSAGQQQQQAAAVAEQQAEERRAPQRQVVSKPVPFGRGHTGYLTFARRVVAL